MNAVWVKFILSSAIIVIVTDATKKTRQLVLKPQWYIYLNALPAIWSRREAVRRTGTLPGGVVCPGE